MSYLPANRWVLGALAAMLALACDRLQAQVRLGDVCNVKGQEERTLHGFGLVVGLKGTGDGDRPATRALAQTMLLMGNAIPRNQTGDFDLTELSNAKNVALVFVTVTVPASGARQGGRLNCTVSAISAKSLAGGTLLITPLLGPVPGDRTTYGMAHGPITLESAEVPTVGRVHEGCQLNTDFAYTFQEEGYVTLVVKESHASFKMAHTMENAINQYFQPHASLEDPSQRARGDRLAVAVDARNVVVRIPDQDRDSPVEFLAQLMSLPIEIREIAGTRVFVSERAQLIVVGEEVAIRPVALAVKNLSVQAGGAREPTFTAFERPTDSSDPTFALRSLVNALNALRVDTPDMIEVIKALEKEGALLGDLVIE